MSNIVLQPNASGTGNITIATPNTNTDRTLNIPDVAGNIVTTGDTGSVSGTMLAADSVDGAKINDNAFMTDLWVLHQDRTMSSSSCRLGFNDSTLWTQATEASNSGYAYGTLGTNKMSVSSDVFTFPTTGLYRIDYHFQVIADGSDPTIRGDINTTIDGSTFLDTAKHQIYNTTSGQTAGGNCFYIFRCSNTTTHKVRFTLDSGTGATIEGGGLGNNSVGPMSTYVMFQRLGD